MDKYYFFKSYHTALKDLKASTRYAIREAIDEFMFEDKLPVFTDNLSKSIWSLLLPTLHKSKVRYEAGKQTFSKTQAKVEQNPSKSGANQEQSSSLLPVCSSKEKGERKKEINNTPIIPQGGVASAFDKFWEAYPLKKGKQAARRAFDRARKLTTLDNMLSAIRKQKGWEQWTRDNGKYIPHPATWLNQGRWDDQSDVDTEPEKPAPPPRLEACPLCGSADFRQRVDYGICNACGKGFSWHGWKKIWKEDK